MLDALEVAFALAVDIDDDAEEMDEEAWEMLNRPVAGGGLGPFGRNGDGGDVEPQSEGTSSLAPPVAKRWKEHRRLQATSDDHLKAALGMLVRMTRLHDLGLAQLLCMPEEGDASGEGDGDEPVRSPVAGREKKEGLLRDTGAGPLQDTGAQPLQATEVV